jgi:hypothetical protein
MTSRDIAPSGTMIQHTDAVAVARRPHRSTPSLSRPDEDGAMTDRTAVPARRVLAALALGTIAALATACSSTQSTVTVTAPPSTGSSPTAAASQSASPTPAASPTAAAGPAECSSAALRLSLGHGGAAAGTAYTHVDFTNISSASCFMQGYPGVSLVSAGSNAGSQIGSDAKRDATFPARPITLAPGQTAHTLLGVVDAGNYPPSACQPVTAHWLKVFPPDNTVALYVHFTTLTCASTSRPTMHVTTIVAGG